MIYQHIYLKPKLEQKLSPAVIQNLKILQFSQIELNDYLKSELEENPLLDADESTWFSSEELRSYLNHLNQSTVLSANKFSEDTEVQTSYSPTLFEHLISQANLIATSVEESNALKAVIWSLDEKGYLDSRLEDISSRLNIPLQILESALEKVKTLEPCGVGACHLPECLLLQLDRSDPDFDLLSDLVLNHLELLATNKLTILSKRLNISVSKLESLIAKIRRLDPKPGLKYESNNCQSEEYIIPDISVKVEHGNIQVEILDSTYPKLTINESYRRLLSTDSDPESKIFVTEKLNRAIYILRSLEQRKNTLLSVAKSIVSFQRAFFLQNSGISPLNLGDVAEKIGMHESTVSRAIKGKFIDTPFGIYPLKYFFSNKISGDPKHSSLDVKKLIGEIISGENPSKPYSDQKICDILSRSDIEISRRTVSKYRESLGVRSSSLRKSH